MAYVSCTEINARNNQRQIKSCAPRGAEGQHKVNWIQVFSFAASEIPLSFLCSSFIFLLLKSQPLSLCVLALDFMVGCLKKGSRDVAEIFNHQQ